MHLNIQAFFVFPLCACCAFFVVTVNAQEAETGLASYYAGYLDGQLTGLGELYDPGDLTCAHRTYPRGTLLKITNLSNGKSVVARVNDRGPFREDFVVDLSLEAARRIGLVDSGTAKVRVERTGMAKNLPEANAALPTDARAHTLTRKGFEPVKAPSNKPIRTLSDDRGGFTVQLGIFTSFQNAADRIRSLEGEGIDPVFLLETEGSRGILHYKVVTGHFGSREKAEKRKADLREHSGLEGFIISLPGSAH